MRLANRIVVLMKTVLSSQGGVKVRLARPARLRMTRVLAEKRAVGDASARKFDGVAFLRTLRK